LTWKRIKEGKHVSLKNSAVLNRVYSYFIFFGINLYTFILSSIISPLKCVEQSDGSYFIDTFPSELCYQSEWNKNFPFVLLFFFAYGFLIPACLAFVLFRYGRGDGSDTLWFTVRFGFLTKPYRKEVYYWELVNLLRRAAFVASTSFWRSNSSQYEVKMMTTLLLLFFFLWFDIFVSPYSQGTRTTAAM
jgi:hypothetical protein